MVVKWQGGEGGTRVRWKGQRWQVGKGGRVVRWQGGEGERVVRWQDGRFLVFSRQFFYFVAFLPSFSSVVL